LVFENPAAEGHWDWQDALHEDYSKGLQEQHEGTCEMIDWDYLNLMRN
jgi:hypothetical protein